MIDLMMVILQPRSIELVDISWPYPFLETSRLLLPFKEKGLRLSGRWLHKEIMKAEKNASVSISGCWPQELRWPERGLEQC